MRPWLPDPRVLNVLIRSGISIGPEDVKPSQPLWRLELRKQLQEKPTSDGKPMTPEEADSCIDKALANGALDSDGIFTFRVKGTREQIVEQILQVCELWNEPMTRAKAEAKADAAIKAMRSQRVFAWLSWAISILAIILAMSLIIGTITAQADPCACHPRYERNRGCIAPCRAREPRPGPDCRQWAPTTTALGPR